MSEKPKIIILDDFIYGKIRRPLAEYFIGERHEKLLNNISISILL